MQISGMRGAAERDGGDAAAPFTARGPQQRGLLAAEGCRGSEPVVEQSPLGKQRPPGMGTAGGKGAFPRAAEGSKGPELGANMQTWRGTPYLSILGLGEVNEIRLFPPTVLLPLVEAICQDDAALALEESTLGERENTSEL